MKVNVGSCNACPFKKTGTDIRCRLADLVLFSDEEGGPDVLTDGGVHPSCPMIDVRISVTLSDEAREKATGRTGAYVGWRVSLKNGMIGIVIRKYRDFAGTGMNSTWFDNNGYSKEEAAQRWYTVLLDGSGMAICPEDKIDEVLATEPNYNFNPDYYLHFGDGRKA